VGPRCAERLIIGHRIGQGDIYDRLEEAGLITRKVVVPAMGGTEEFPSTCSSSRAIRRSPNDDQQNIVSAWQSLRQVAGYLKSISPDDDDQASKMIDELQKVALRDFDAVVQENLNE
jgi:hypothetical protein